MAGPKPDKESVDRYIAGFTGEARQRLEKVRRLIAENAPYAIEKMSYGVPSFQLNTNRIVYAAFKNHLGLYPGPSAIQAFSEHLKDYPTSEETIRFAFDEPMPYDLVVKITRFCVDEQTGNKK